MGVKAKGKGKKKFTNTVLLWISIGLSTYIFAQMTDLPVIWFLFFAVISFFEIVMQDVLGIGIVLFKQGFKTGIAKGFFRIIGGVLCFALYLGGYVGIYAVPTAMGVFLLHIDQQSIKAEITQTEYELQKRILDLDLESLENYNLQMRAESKTGYGKQSEKVTAEQNKLREGLEARLEKFRNISKEKEKVSVDVFISISETVKPIMDISPTTIKFIMFMTLFFGIYLGLIFTHPEFGLKDGGEEGNEECKEKEDDKTSATKKNKPSRKLRDKTSQEEESFAESSGQSSSESSEVMTPKVSVSEKTSLEGLPRITKVPKPQSEWERFVRASIRESGNLNSAKRVSMLTGIPLDRCLDYRKRLEAMTIGGELVVETTQGVSRAKFEKEVILERVREAI